MAQRIVRNRSATLAHTFLEDGVPTDPYPDQATVTVVRDNGDVITADGATENLADPGRASYTLTPDETGLLDRLHLTWRAPFGGRTQVYQEWVEIVGGTYFTLGDARARPGLQDTSAVTSTELLQLRNLAEEAIERRTGRAFVPRYAHDLVMPDRRGVRLSHPMWVRTIRSLSLDGTAAWEPAAMAGVRVDRGGYLYTRTAGFGAGIGYGCWEADVIYEHGTDEPPPDIARAALNWVEYLATSEAGALSVDPQAASLTTDDGTITYSRSPGNAPPAVEAVLSSYTVLVA